MKACFSSITYKNFIVVKFALKTLYRKIKHTFFFLNSPLPVSFTGFEVIKRKEAGLPELAICNFIVLFLEIKYWYTQMARH
jgi:hypothetical protein